MIKSSLASQGYPLHEKELYYYLSEEDRDKLEACISSYEPEGESATTTDAENKKPIRYVPVWVDDKVAHDQYDGYCKTS